MVMPTGKEPARTGGKLSGGSRAATALKKIPTVKVLGVAAPRKGTYPPSPLRVPVVPTEVSPSTTMVTAAASAAAEAAVAALGLSPTTAGIMKGVAVAAAVAATAAAKAYRPTTAPPAPVAARRAGKAKMRLVLPAKDAASTPAPRGTALIVVPTTSYGARHDYYWEDIVATGQLLLAGKITTYQLRKTNSAGDLIHHVPYGTMLHWHTDDDEVMRKLGKRGMSSKPHWLVELEVRRRKVLPLPLLLPHVLVNGMFGESYALNTKLVHSKSNILHSP